MDKKAVVKTVILYGAAKVLSSVLAVMLFTKFFDDSQDMIKYGKIGLVIGIVIFFAMLFIICRMDTYEKSLIMAPCISFFAEYVIASVMLMHAVYMQVAGFPSGFILLVVGMQGLSVYIIPTIISFVVFFTGLALSGGV